MGGVALSGYFTPRIAKHGDDLPFLVVAGALVVYALVAAVLVSDHPGRKVPTDTLAHRLGVAGKLRVTWELSALYAIGFGGIVAFGVYLPTYLKTWYEMSPTEAGTKAAGFALVTVVFRPIGGWLSDRAHPALVTSAALLLAALMAIVQAFEPPLNPVGTIALLAMAAGLGTASGSVFALVSQVTPQPKVGSVTGIVGAMGGLGGFVPPLVMGAIYSAKDSYAIGFMLLSDLALAGCVYAYGRMRTIQRDERGRRARRNGRAPAGTRPSVCGLRCGVRVLVSVVWARTTAVSLTASSADRSWILRLSKMWWALRPPFAASR